MPEQFFFQNMASIAVSVFALQGMVYAAKKYPLHFPRRLQHITEFLQKRHETLLPQDTPQININISKQALKRMKRKCDQTKNLSQNDVYTYVFDCSYEHCRELYDFVSAHPELLSNVEDFAETFFLSSDMALPGHKEIILMPSECMCSYCDTVLDIDPRASYPLVYTKFGVKIAAAYLKRCMTCKITYTHSYLNFGKDSQHHFSDGLGKRLFKKDCHLASEFLQISICTVFQLKYLKQVHCSLIYSAITFEAAAAAYNTEHNSKDSHRLINLLSMGRKTTTPGSTPWTLHQQRLEEAWFIWRILCRVSIINAIL